MARAFVNGLSRSSECFPLLSEKVESERPGQPALIWFSNETATVVKEIAVDFAILCRLPSKLLH